LSLVVAAVFFGVMPVLADTWYSQGRPQLAWQWIRCKPDTTGPRPEQNRVGRFSAAESRSCSGRPTSVENEPQLYVDLGDAELKLGDRASAGRDYNRALLIDPYFAPPTSD